MSKKLLEIDTFLGVPPDSVKVAKVWLEKKGDLYVTNHATEIMAGKFSYHSSGVTHRYSELLKSRSGEGEPPHRKLRGLKGFVWVHSFGCPNPLAPTGEVPKPDTAVRRTLITPRAEIGFHWHVWAIERGRKDLLDKISNTDPWPSIPIVATLLADWTDPWLLITVANWTNTTPYRVVQYYPPIPCRVPFVMIPDAFEGTWLERPGPKWRPGEPLPEEWLREADEFVARQRAREERRARKLGLWIPPRY